MNNLRPMSPLQRFPPQETQRTRGWVKTEPALVGQILVGVDIARRFEISLRQAQKYALAWKTFFDQDRLPENVNIDVFLLDQPSWYVVAATETEHPHRWLAYAQDRKIGDPKYSISTFRQDIRQAKEANLIPRVNEGVPDVGLPRLGDPRCPWVKEFCVASGNPVPLSDCQACEFQKTKNCETKPISEEV